MKPGWDRGDEWSRNGIKGMNEARMESLDGWSRDEIRVVDGPRMGSEEWMEPGWNWREG